VVAGKGVAVVALDCRGSDLGSSSGGTVVVKARLSSLDEVWAFGESGDNPIDLGYRVFRGYFTNGAFEAGVRKRCHGPQERRKCRKLSNTKQASTGAKPGEAVLMLEFLKDLWAYMRERKKFWLAPIILIMVLLGALIVLTQGSAVAPFIYTLF